ncbi:hypothetical protein EIP91_009136 [Steccherinum ochraceum]|uniref:F-box domain-containing protein n=1 Tax=Steccherinum ochraceum TaxID=92696 RepID=A0A4R0R208_9APHY|nr:hypothetical protein EIP91_009136 [Steccherinum ochraceum]
MSTDLRDAFVSDVEATIEACHGVIKLYQRMIGLLGAKRNACTITHRLPSEVLGEIMWNTLDDRGSHKLVPLESVCRHWRDVALDTPKLWSYIVAGTRSKHRSIHAQTALILRSKSALLHINILLSEDRGPNQYSRDTLRLLLSSLPRISHLHLTLSKKPMETFAELFPEPLFAPQLQSLVMSIHHTNHRVSLPSFAPEGLPRLTELVLKAPYYHCDKLLPSLVTSNITVFEISGSLGSLHPGHIGIVTSDALAVALRAMPRLQTLILKDHILVPPLVELDNPVYLSHLRSLILQDSLISLIWVMDNLRFPSEAPISFTHGNSGDDHLAGKLKGSLMTYLHSDTPGIHEQHTPSLCAALWGVGGRPAKGFGFKMQLWAGTKEEASPLSGRTIFIEILNGWTLYPGVLWNALPLYKVSCLTFHGGSSSYTGYARWSTFMECAQRMSNVKMLRFLDWDPEVVAGSDLVLCPGRRNEEHAFPQLRELEFRNLTSGDVADEWKWMPRTIRLRGWKTPTLADPWPVERIRVLKRTLVMWEVGRGPMDRISFVNCNSLSIDQLRTFGLRADIVKY